MNFNLVSITLVLFSISAILPCSFSQDANALQKQYGGLISQGLGAIQDAAKKNGGEGSSNIQNLIQSAKTVQAKCVQQLMPCKDYFKDSKADNIPQSCCQPMRAVISDDMDCLCGVVKGEGLLKNINLTLDNVFNVAKACGAEPDMDACDDAQAPAPSATKFNTLTKPTTPAPESSPEAPSPDSSKEAPSPDSSKESSDDSSIETPSPESSPSPDSSLESSPSPDSSDEIPSPESSPAPDSSASTPPPEPSLADTPAAAPASLDAPADDSGAQMEESSLIVLVLAFILLAI